MAKQSTAITSNEATQAAALGRLLFDSGMFKDVSDAAQAAVKVLAGKEVGVGPIQAILSLNCQAIERLKLNNKPVADSIGHSQFHLSDPLCDEQFAVTRFDQPFPQFGATHG